MAPTMKGETDRRVRVSPRWQVGTVLSRLLGWSLLLSAGTFTWGFVLFVANLSNVETRPTHHADGMVVLTGGTDRVADAVDLLAEGHADRLLITGVNPGTSRESLERRMPRERDLISCCVDLGYQALNTAGNARETAEWVHDNKLRSLIVVTSNYHMPRALAEIGEALPTTDLQPYPVVADRIRTGWWSDAQRARLIAWEYLKYLAVRTRTTLLPRKAEPTSTELATRAE
jgi:uncharacterized SAM-binding protein YcdF (DUF218 family)